MTATRMPRPSGSARAECHVPVSRAMRSSSALGSPISWSARMPGAMAVMVSARLASLSS